MSLLREAGRRIAPYFRNLGGWTTNRKLLVIESDDWGSIRMPSREIYERCLKAGYPVDQNAYERYNSLLSEDDLELLFDVLSSVKDSKGAHPVITANVIMANPDFDAIRETGCERYCFEPFARTFERYAKHGRCAALWAEGMRKGVLHPQFHGREHLNVAMFMDALRGGDEDARFAFDCGMPGIMRKSGDAPVNPYVEATRFRSAEEKAAVLDAQLEGLQMFRAYFGFHSRSMIPTNYCWSRDFDQPVATHGVECFQGVRAGTDQQIDGTGLPVRRRAGAKNAKGQVSLLRNAIFEPSLVTDRDQALANCLRQINAAFRMRKPAVITCHRLNFSGFVDEANRDCNLRLLSSLLGYVRTKWPEVEFISSEGLLDIILQNERPEGADVF